MALNSEPQAPPIGDPSRWVDRYGDALLRYARSRVGRREVAEDLVQETFLAAWSARESFDGRASLGTWLCGILRRKVADYYRRVGRERIVVDIENEDQHGPLFNKRGKWLDRFTDWQQSPEELVENSEFWAVLAHCLSDLPAHLAEAFQLRELRHLSMRDISTSMGLTPSNLAVRLHRARLLLRRCLDQQWFHGGK